MMSTFLACFLIGSILSGAKGVLVEVAVNGLAILPCNVQNQDNNTVKWFRNPNTLISQSLHVVSTFRKRMSIVQPYSGEWNLHIKQVQLGDAGNYSCRAGSDVIEQVDLMVQFPPMIHETHETTFNEGDTGTLWCNATGYPTPNVRWSFKSPNRTDEIDSTAEGNRLVLHNITRYYDNIYVCLASNTAGKEHREIRIHVNFGPEVEIFQNTVNATLGQEVTLHCMVTAYPMDGKLEWVFLKNNLSISENWKYELATDSEMTKDYNTCFASMTIRKGEFGNGDYGYYVCRTRNFTRGYSEKVFNVQKPVEHNVDGIIPYGNIDYA